MKKVIEGVYKIIFNVLGKKQGVNNSTHTTAGLLTGIVILFFFLSIFLLISYCINERFYLNDSKGLIFILGFIYLGICYFILFKVWNFDKTGSDENSLFRIEKEVLRSSSIVLYTTLSISLLLIIIDILFFSKK